MSILNTNNIFSVLFMKTNITLATSALLNLLGHNHLLPTNPYLAQRLRLERTHTYGHRIVNLKPLS